MYGTCSKAIEPTNHEPRCALRSDIYEETSVKTGARRLRDFSDIHSASTATAEHHERVCGRSNSIPRRRNAPLRTSGCDLGPALDLDLDSLFPAGPMCAAPRSRWLENSFEFERSSHSALKAVQHVDHWPGTS
jgi:hypothetical protein